MFQLSQQQWQQQQWWQQRQQHFIYYWPNFDQTLKIGFLDQQQQQQQYLSYYLPDLDQSFNLGLKDKQQQSIDLIFAQMVRLMVTGLTSVYWFQAAQRQNLILLPCNRN